MRRLLTVTGFTALLTLVKMGMGFVIAKVVAINAGPSGMAMLGQLQSLTQSLNGLVNSPVGSGVVRYTAENQQGGIAACALWWRASVQWVLVILSIVVPVAIFFSSHISNWLLDTEAYGWAIVLAAFALPFAAMGTFCNSVINGYQDYKRFVILGMISAVTSSCIMIYFVLAHNIGGALFAAAIQSAIVGCVVIIACIRLKWMKISYLFGRVDQTHRNDIRGYVLMAVTSAITAPVSLMLVRKILVAEVGWDITGHWDAVWRISSVYLGVITTALGTYYLPRLSSISVDSIKKEVNRTVIVIVPIVAFLAILVYLSRDLAISILFTDEFRGARDLFSIQLCGDIVKIASWMYAYPMLARGATIWFISTEIVFSATFVLLTATLVPILGVKGATIAYLVSYSICLIFIYTNLKNFAR